MGTVVTYERSESFFRRTLALLEPHLAANGHVGYVNLNTIVNERGIWPLELTCRFGYPGYAILSPLQRTPWGELFAAMLHGGRFEAHAGFATGIVVTTPPFPYSRLQVDEAVGLPVLFEGVLDPEDERNVHYGEVGLAAGQLVTSGLYGWTMVVTGVGPTVAASRDAAYARVRRVFVPNARYRLDIGARLVAQDWARVEALGVLDAV
jgi:phosphoribosylamine--glycine ligase